MYQPLAVKETTDGYKTIETYEHTDHLIKNKRKIYEEATDDTLLNEYETRGNGDRDRPHGPQNRTADFEETTEGNDRHDPDQSTAFTYANKERKDKIGPAQIVRNTNIFSIENASFSDESLETDNVNAKEHPYEKWNNDFLKDFLWKKNHLASAVYFKISIESLDRKWTCIPVI